jgi:arylformamidase
VRTPGLQLSTVPIENLGYAVDFSSPQDLAIALDFDDSQPRWFAAPPAQSSALVSGNFTGRVQSGASCNCSTVTLTPHLDGTHTECVGHLTLEGVKARDVVPVRFLKAWLLSVTPVRADLSGEGSVPPPRSDDLLITAAAMARGWPEASFGPEALIVRTRPNPRGKRARDYRSQPAAFLTREAASLLVARGIEHLVLDVPSADRADDGGQLRAHREFFGLPPGSSSLADVRRPQCTITELAYVDDAVADGPYLLSLQIPAFGGDAVPSRPVLYPVRRV